MIELDLQTINKSLDFGKMFNDSLTDKESQAVDLVSEIIQSESSPLIL